MHPISFYAKQLAILIILGGICSLARSEDQRLALVITNSTYAEKGLSDLPNAAADGELLTSALKASGFSVTQLNNLGKDQLKRSVSEFAEKVHTGDECVFYFAGHGFESGLQPTILGVDATIDEGASLKGMLEINHIVNTIADRDPRVALFFIDSCREQLESIQDSVPPLRRVVDQSTSGYPELMVSFSSEPGGFALEGSELGLPNSPYATNLAKGIAEGRNLRELLQTVRQEVYRITGGRQRTWESSSVVEDYYISKTGFKLTTEGDELTVKNTASPDTRVIKKEVPDDGKKREWEIYRSQGKEYVSAKNIVQFYKFERYQKIDETSLFIHPSMAVRQIEGTTEVYFNNILYHLSLPTIRDGENLFFSTADLANLCDPVIRPGSIKGSSKIKTVLLLFDQTPTSETAVFQNALDEELALLEQEESLTCDTLITRSDKERAEWLAENAEGDGTVLLYCRFDVPGLAPNSISTFTLAPMGEPPTGGRFSDAISLPMRGNEHNKHNIAIATSAHSFLIHYGVSRDDMPLVDLGIGRSLLPELRGLGCPAALLEIGRLTGTWKEEPDRIAKYLHLGLSKYIEACGR